MNDTTPTHISQITFEVTEENSRNQECVFCHTGDTKQFRPRWEELGSGSASDLYCHMAWQAQEQKFPRFMCDECGFFSNEQREETYEIINYMLNFALTAAGVADDWKELFNTVKAKLENR